MDAFTAKRETKHKIAQINCNFIIFIIFAEMYLQNFKPAKEILPSNINVFKSYAVS